MAEAAYTLYGMGIFLLLLVLVTGQVRSGAQRWIHFGFFSIQPSELVKVFVIAGLGQIFFPPGIPGRIWGSGTWWDPGCWWGCPFLLILKQPDLGTALHLAFACLSVLLYLRVRPAVMLTLSGGMAVALPFAWHFLKEYQKNRIRTFLNPEQDPLGAGLSHYPVQDSRGLGPVLGQGVHEGNSEPVAFPA